MSQKNEPRMKKIVDAADGLSLGISIVVAVLLGFGVGYGLKKVTGISWLLWLGIFWGIAGAVLNVYRAYKKQKDMYDELAKDPRYSYKKQLDDEDEDDR